MYIITDNGVWPNGLPESTFVDCTITGNVITGTYSTGGGFDVTGGQTTLTRTLIADNTPANVVVTSGILYYALPTVPGYWLPNAACVVNREACGESETDCINTRDACSIRSGSPPSYRPTVSGFLCKPHINIQPW